MVAMSFVRRLIGVLFTPRTAYADIVASPRSLVVLACVATAAAGSLYVFLSSEVGQEAYVDQRIRSVEAFGGEVTDAEYAALKSASLSAAPRLAGTVFVAVPLAAILLSGSIVVASRFGSGAPVTLARALGVVAHSGLVIAVWRLVSFPLDYGRRSMLGATSLGALASFVDDTSPLARFLGTVDLFLVWWILSLSIGVSVLLGRRARSVVGVALSIYAVAALALTALTAVLGAE